MVDARALLSYYRDDALLAEHAAWESVRAKVIASRYAPPTDATARTIISLDGTPGAGKSTTQRWLQPALGAAYFSMARFAESRGITADARLSHQLQTGTPHAVDEEFIATIAACPSPYILLEKFPRSVIEATAMLEATYKHGWRFEVLHLTLPGDCVALSTRRQLERGPRHGRMPTAEHAEHRALVHLARSTSARETLRAHGAPIHAFDMTRPQEENAAAIRRALGLDLARLAWHLPPLETLARVAKRVGVDEAWVTSGSVYRAFWNGRFGPMQLPTDVDVAVSHEREVEPLRLALERAAPHERWSVLCPSTRLRERYGIETATAAEAKRFATFVHRSGLVRQLDGAIECVLPEGAEACLRNGIVQLNGTLLERVTAEQRELVLRRETHHLPRALSDYPALRVAIETATLLRGGEHWRDHSPRTVGSNFKALKASVVRALRERQGASAPHCRRALGAEEQEVALEILRFHQHSDFKAEAPPLPPRGVARRELSGLEEFAREADDAAFGEWFLDQVHHHQPTGGADPYLRAVLDFTVFGRKPRTESPELSPMHQGWPLDRHLAQSVLQLKTDGLLERLEAGHDGRWLSNLRLCMRLAMLFHDTGKLVGLQPRRHTQISARLFARVRPQWLPAPLLAFTQWLIRTHDLFGAVGRALTDKQGHPAADYSVELSKASSYYGALDAQAARRLLLEAELPLHEAAAINKELWSADVGSIAALRWLLPVAALVERLLAHTRTPTFAGTERRRDVVRGSAPR